MKAEGILNLIFLVIALTGVVSGYANYCDSSLCKDDQKHIGCRNLGRHSPTCGNKVETVRFGEPEIARMLKRTNEVRNKIAGGSPRLPKAVRMRAVVWDRELAELAVLQTMTCRMFHDECRNTKAYKYSGQNIYMMTANRLPNINKIIDLAVNKWVSEVRNLKIGELRSYPSKQKPPNKAIGHFTVLVNDRVTAVGCGYTTWKVNDWHHVLLTCNYASTNIIGYPTFKQGQVAGSKCRKKHKTLKNLCAKDENIDPNNVTK